MHRVRRPANVIFAELIRNLTERCQTVRRTQILCVACLPSTPCHIPSASGPCAWIQPSVTFSFVENPSVSARIASLNQRPSRPVAALFQHSRFEGGWSSRKTLMRTNVCYNITVLTVIHMLSFTFRDHAESYAVPSDFFTATRKMDSRKAVSF